MSTIYVATTSAASFWPPAEALVASQSGNVNKSSIFSRETICSGFGRGFCSTASGVGVASDVDGGVVRESAVLIGMSAVLGLAGFAELDSLAQAERAKPPANNVNPPNHPRRLIFSPSRSGLFTIKLQSPPSGLVAYDVYATHLAFVVLLYIFMAK